MSNPKGNIKHGGAGTLTYARWKSMMARCHNPNATNYRYYGAAGIIVCERWRDFASFRTDMGECPDRSMTLDRIDNALDYEPGNCRWATKAQQNAHRPSHAVQLAHDGVTRSVASWAAETGIKANVISMRLRLGWSHAEALTTPLQGSGRFGDR